MNWTGGRLSRHTRNANGSLIHRQKQHFAKARINLLNDPQKTSTVTWSIFDEVERAAQGHSLTLSTTPHLSGHNQPDVGLKDPKDRGRPKKSQRPENNLKSPLPEATFQGDKRSGFGPEPNGGSLTNGGSHSSVYRETRSISCAEIGKKQAPSVEAADGVNVIGEADTLEERRRRILRKIDWVGANIQHPIKLRFMVIENDERLGKRRRITARHQSQFGAIVQPIVTFPFAKKQKIHGSLSTQNANGDSGEALPNNVRISIGGRHVGAGVASSTGHSKTVGGRFVTSQASTPDVMLLDGDDMSRQQRQQSQERREHLLYPASPPLAPSSAIGKGSTFSASPRNLPIYTPHRKKILTHYNGSNATAGQRAGAAFLDLKRRIPAVRTRINDSAVDVGPQLEERINNLREPSDQHIAFVTKCNPNLAILRGRGIENDPGSTNLKHADANEIQDHRRDSESPFHNASYITDISKQLSTSARKLQSVAQEKLQRTAQINSQPQLFHPIPLTSRTSRVLSRTSSEADTAVVQIGVEPVATRSQILDEEVWKTWVLSSKDDLASASENGRDDDVSISPGISNFGHRYVREDSKRTIKEDAICIKSSSEVNSIDYTSDREREQSKFKRSMDIEGKNNRKEILPNVQESASHEDLPPTKEVVDYKALFLQGPQKIPSLPKPKPVRVENRDEAWMKFILSDNDDDTEEGIMRPSGQQKSISPTVIQHPPAYSVVVHLSSETSSSSQLEAATSSRAGAVTTPGHTNTNIANLSTYGPQLSNYTTQGSNQSSSDRLSDILSSVDQIPTQSAPSFSTSSRPIRKFTFTKPPRFPSPYRGSSPETTAATAGSPIHIGRSFLNRVAAVAMLKGSSSKKRKEERQYEKDIYSLEDDVESIEED